MSCKLEPTIWSRGTGQWIACFDRHQLIIAGMSNFKEVHGKLRLYVSFLEYGRHVGQLRHRRCRHHRRRRAYAPTSNTASQDNHEKINSWVSFIFPLYDEYIWGSAWWPELHYKWCTCWKSRNTFHYYAIIFSCKLFMDSPIIVCVNDPCAFKEEAVKEQILLKFGWCFSPYFFVTFLRYGSWTRQQWREVFLYRPNVNF